MGVHLLTGIAFQTLPHIVHSRINLHGDGEKQRNFNNAALNIQAVNFQAKITLKETYLKKNTLKASFFSMNKIALQLKTSCAPVTKVFLPLLQSLP